MTAKDKELNALKISINRTLVEFEYDSKFSDGVEVSKEDIIKKYPIFGSSRILNINILNKKYSHGCYPFAILFVNGTTLRCNLSILDITKLTNVGGK